MDLPSVDPRRSIHADRRTRIRAYIIIYERKASLYRVLCTDGTRKDLFREKPETWTLFVNQYFISITYEQCVFQTRCACRLCRISLSSIVTLFRSQPTYLGKRSLQTRVLVTRREKLTNTKELALLCALVSTFD